MATNSTVRTIRFMAPIEDVSAKFARVIDTSSNTAVTGKISHRWFGAAVRKTARQGIGVQSKQVFVYRKFARQSAYGQNEITNQNYFSFSSTWASDSLDNLSIIATIQANFKNGVPAAGVSPRGYTLRGWVFAVRYQQKKDDPTIEPGSSDYNLWPA